MSALTTENSMVYGILSLRSPDRKGIGAEVSQYLNECDAYAIEENQIVLNEQYGLVSVVFTASEVQMKEIKKSYRPRLKRYFPKLSRLREPGEAHKLIHCEMNVSARYEPDIATKIKEAIFYSGGNIVEYKGRRVVFEGCSEPQFRAGIRVTFDNIMNLRRMREKIQELEEKKYWNIELQFESEILRLEPSMPTEARPAIRHGSRIQLS